MVCIKANINTGVKFSDLLARLTTNWQLEGNSREPSHNILKICYNMSETGSSEYIYIYIYSYDIFIGNFKQIVIHLSQ